MISAKAELLMCIPYFRDLFLLDTKWSVHARECILK